MLLLLCDDNVEMRFGNSMKNLSVDDNIKLNDGTVKTIEGDDGVNY